MKSKIVACSNCYTVYKNDLEECPQCGETSTGKIQSPAKKRICLLCYIVLALLFAGALGVPHLMDLFINCCNW